jgi:hypothetical protein
VNNGEQEGWKKELCPQREEAKKVIIEIGLPLGADLESCQALVVTEN